FSELKPGVRISLDGAVFPRLQDKGQEKHPQETKRTDGVLLDIKDFARVDLRVAEVLQAEQVSGADKLLKLQIDVGDEKRQIVAGIGGHYAAETLVGRKIIVVANLKPTRIRGIESNGMLLAATAGKKLVLLTPDGDLPAGAKVS
ncbi:MAG: methionine--tRNA ligase subunit beta, partial [Candidatus Zixiibacteriota bacterium]